MIPGWKATVEPLELPEPLCDFGKRALTTVSQGPPEGSVRCEVFVSDKVSKSECSCRMHSLTAWAGYHDSDPLPSVSSSRPYQVLISLPRSMRIQSDSLKATGNPSTAASFGR